MNMPAFIAASAVALLSVGLTPAASAQPYPARPVRIVVGFPPGGAVDILVRILSPRLSSQWGQQVIVDNRPGAGARIAAETVANAPSDGYTLLAITMSHAVGAGLYKKLPYDPVNSFTAVAQIGTTPLVLVTHPSLPVKTVQDLIKLAKAHPTDLIFGSSGTGTPTHLAGELFKKMAGVKLVHVPYKGSGPAFIDLIAGRVAVSFPALPGALPHIRAGRLRAIAVTSTSPSKSLPGVPTIAESGVPGYEIANWYGILAPAGTDPKVVEQIQKPLASILKMRDTAVAFDGVGAEPVTTAPKQFDAYLKSEVKRWREVIMDAGITPN